MTKKRKKQISFVNTVRSWNRAGNRTVGQMGRQMWMGQRKSWVSTV